eukprot:458225_1
MTKAMESFLTLIYTFQTIIITHSQQYIYDNTHELSKSNADDMCLFYYDEYLSSMHSESDRSAAQSTVPTTSWIGVSDVVENTWVWSDNTPFDYGTTYSTSPWHGGEPNNSGGEDCVTIGTGGTWNDDGCWKEFPSLCNYPQPIPVVNDKSNYMRIRGEGNIIGNIDILDEIYIEFYITFTTWSTGWAGIIHCGDDDTIKLPGIYAENDNKYIRSFFQTILSNPSVNTATGLALNTEYHYSLYQTQRHLKITFAGSTIHDADTDSGHIITMDQGLYLWYSSSMGATIRGLQITTQNSPNNRYWNYICDWYNRWTYNDGAGLVNGYGANDGDCSIRQTGTPSGTGVVAWMGVTDTTSLSWTDYKLEIKLRIISGVEAGPIFRANGANCNPNDCGQYYQLQIRDDKIVFAKMNDGYTELAAHTMTTTWNTIYLWRVEAIGNTFKIYRDNEYITTWTDSSYASGSVGFRTYQADARISKLRITFVTNQQQYTGHPTQSPTPAPIFASLSCPVGSTQIGAINVDITGCGLEACDTRYNKSTVEECLIHCIKSASCRSFTWAPIGNEQSHPANNVCSIYSEESPTNTYGWNQIFCRVNTNSPTKYPTNSPSQSPTVTTTSPTSTTNNPTISPSKSPTQTPTSDTFAPTQSSVNPTLSPSTQYPSVSPSQYPSKQPTNTPSQYPSQTPSRVYNPTSSASWCISVLEILTGVTTNDFANDDELLLFTMNNTKLAIYDVVRNSYKYDISVLCVDVWRCFFLTVTNIDDINSDSGTMINFDVCAWKENVYNALLDKIESDGDEMEAFMVQQLKSYLMSTDDPITVSIVIKQTHGQVVTTLSSSNDEQIAGDNSDEQIGESLQLWIILAVIVVTLFLAALVIVFYLFCYKRFKNRNGDINNMNKSNHVTAIETGSPVAVQMERVNSDEGMSLDNDEISIIQAVNKTDMGIGGATMGNDVIIYANTPEHEQNNNNDENVSVLKPPLIVTDFGNTEGNGENYVDVKNKNKNNKEEDDTEYL